MKLLRKIGNKQKAICRNEEMGWEARLSYVIIGKITCGGRISIQEPVKCQPT